MTMIEKARQNRLNALDAIRIDVTNIFSDDARCARHTRPVLTLLAGAMDKQTPGLFDPDLGLRLAA